MGELKINRAVFEKINSPYSGKKLELFVSYSSNDGHMAGQLKDNLENYGISAFLAHEDTKPGRDWAKELEKRLEKCSAVLPLISKNFLQSEWTGQEVGYAYAKNKLILPLKTSREINPGGFIARSQALRLDLEI